ncbi:MAG: ATP-binding protein [Runella zeae]
MQKINYLKLQNFKIFGEEVTINFDNPTVLIGANNAGKTTVIQSIALWSWALKIWFEKKGNSKNKAERNKGVALNRLEIAQVPIKEARYFWNNTKVRQNSNDNIGLIITLGISHVDKAHEGNTHEIGIIFKYHSPDLLYCQPTEESFKIEGLLEKGKNMSINLLYPMSGIGEKEFVFQEDAIRTQIGTGQTSNVIRNICYHLATRNEEDWNTLVKIFKDIFSVEIRKPFLRATGVIELLYNYANKEQKTDYDLDITLAGRGQQQMLLVLAYLISNKGSVLLIDEPDAHLEILRQTQIFTILKQIANRFDCQIIIVTHSEVVLNEANTVIFLADGKAHEISEKRDFKFIKDALKNYGIEHYYKAKLIPRILYVESSTDKAMLKAFADRFKHPSSHLFNDRLNYYYTQNEVGSPNLDNELQRKSGYYRPYRSHFLAIKHVVPLLKGIAIFDGDNKGHEDEISADFACLFWKRYELENYFITPQVILGFAKEIYKEQYGDGGIFIPIIDEKIRILNRFIENELILPVLNNNKRALDDFLQLPLSLQNVQFQNLSTTKKLSELLENTFSALAKETSERILLTKGDFYKLISFVEEIPQEIKEKLDLLDKYLNF